MEKSICIISLSPVYRDGRILRQVKYLAQHYALTVIGYGPAHPSWSNWPHVRWISVQKPKLPYPVALALLLLGKLWPQAYEEWYWRKRQHVQALEYASLSGCDAFYANEWDALPLAVGAAKRNQAKLVYDAHEYTLGQYDDVWWLKRWLMPPAIKHLLQKYTPYVGASITVAPRIAERYAKEFDLRPIVVLNVPESISVPHREVDPDAIHLIHHGSAIRNRRLETMIETLALCSHRYCLHLMLVEHDSGYIEELENLASRLAPGRVFFEDPVAPGEIVRRISEYDVGFYPLEPSNYNNIVALPNKFFHFIAAGLAVCIGPSPSMAEIVHQHRLGRVATSFDPDDIAKMLDQTDGRQWGVLQQAAREAATEFNAEKEMVKVIDLCRRLLSGAKG